MSDTEDEGLGTFIVERILRQRRRNHRVEYLVKWQDYGDEHNTWEPEKNILDPSLIRDFHLETGKRLFRNNGRNNNGGGNNDQNQNDQPTVSSASQTPKPNKERVNCEIEDKSDSLQQPLKRKKHREHGSKSSLKVEQKNKERKEKEEKEKMKKERKHKKKHPDGAQENAVSSTVPSASCTESEPTSTTSQAAILEQPPPIPPELTFKDVAIFNNVQSYPVDYEGKTIIFKEYNL